MWVHDQPQTGDAALQRAVAFLEEKGLAPEVALADARLLLAKALQKEVWHVVLDLEEELPAGAWPEYVSLLEKRGAFVPLHYLLAEKEFMSLPFRVTPAVLIPRWDTESLVEAALKILREKKNPRVLDLGTGCGVIAISLAYYLPQASFVATDISGAALEVAGENARNLGVAEKIRFVRGNLFAALADGERFDAIVCNPPYLSAVEMGVLSLEGKQEPALALDGGPDGLVYYRGIAAKARNYLVPGGNLLLEIGWQQASAVKKILDNYGWGGLRVVQDLEGRDRVIIH